MESIADVDLTPSGVFKYILIKVMDKAGNKKVIVRGYKSCPYHADILDKVQSQLKGIDCECLGGGRINFQPDLKKIKVYGYSMGFGRADHSVTCDILKKRYADHDIEWSNEGY